MTARGRVGRGPETGLIGKRRQRCGAVAPSRDLKRLEEIGFGQTNTGLLAKVAIGCKRLVQELFAVLKKRNVQVGLIRNGEHWWRFRFPHSGGLFRGCEPRTAGPGDWFASPPIIEPCHVDRRRRQDMLQVSLGLPDVETAPQPKEGELISVRFSAIQMNRHRLSLRGGGR